MKIFISYEPDHDQVFVDKLSSALRKQGISPSIINLKLMFGDELIDKIDQALKGCDRIIVVLSKAFNQSKWLEQELFAFLFKERLGRSKLILPIMIEDCQVPAMLENRVCDFRNGFDNGFKFLITLLTKTREVFVIMKFGDSHLNSTYEIAIKPVIEEFKYTAVRIDQIQDSGKISNQILKHLTNSDVVLADLTGERPNCYFEAGFAYALEKEMILTVKRSCPIHFDLADNRFITWETEIELKQALQERFKAIQQRVRSDSNDNSQLDSKAVSSSFH